MDLQARSFLVGPNASGKSNLLDSLLFLRDIVADGGLQNAVQSRGGVSTLRSFHGPEHADIEIHIDVGSNDQPDLWSYQLKFNQDPQRRPKIKREVVQHEERSLLERPAETDEEDPELLTQTHLEQVNVNREFRDLAAFLKGIQYVDIVPELIRDPERSVSEKEDPYGGSFLQQVAETRDQVRNARLRRIQEALGFAVPNLNQLVFERDESTGTPHLKARFGEAGEEGHWQREKHFSAGTLRLIGLLWTAQDKQGPLLMEEPGLSLHAEVVKAIPQMLVRLQRASNRQVLLTTHAMDLLKDEGIGLDEVLLLVPTDEGTRLAPAASVKEARVLLEHGSTMADIAQANTRPSDAVQLGLVDWGE